MRRSFSFFLCLLLLTGCAAAPVVPKDALPSPEASSIPMLDVWVTNPGALIRMDAESYVAGVVAGEIPSNWPMEALKAQAILARTFVLKFLTEKESRYPGADISTDIAEAQAYDASAVNARILQAVHETRGQVLMTADGKLPYAWFHAHSGGTTALAAESLDWQSNEPAYTRSTTGMESSKAPPSTKAWTAEFSSQDFLIACKDAGYTVASCSDVSIQETGPSGRVVTLLVDGVSVNAARLRISLGSTRMRSTLLTDLSISDKGTIHMAGLGYGHGVGMPQWGAYALAEAGWTAKEIALHYYNDLHIAQAW